METIALARSGMDLPLRFTIPYSVTTYIMSARVVVITLPGVRSSTIRLARTPWRSYVEGMQMNALPSLEGEDPAPAHAVALIRGGHADERLAVLGGVGAADELRLPAGAADVAVAGG